jgi:hypothetical protein
MGNKNEKKTNTVEFPPTEPPPPTATDANNYTKIDDDITLRKPSIFTVEKLNEQYHLNQDFDESPIDGTWNYIKKYYKPTPAFFKRQLFKRIPFLEWIQHYNTKEWIVPDIVSGLTIGIVHIPQGNKKLFFFSNQFLYEKYFIRTCVCYSCWFTTSYWSLCFIFPGDSLCFSWFITAFKYW